MKRLLMFLFLGIFLISLSSAQTHTLREELDIKIVCLNNGYCSNESFCNINVIDPDSDLVVTNQNMTYNISYHNYTITPNKTGEYKVDGFCKDGEMSEEIDYTFEVTGDGTALGIPKALIEIILLLFFIGTLAGFYYIKQKVDFGKWENSIVEKYKSKNIVKMVLSMLLFHIMKQSFFTYYLIGFPIMSLVTSLSFTYSIASLQGLLEVLLSVYSWGTLIVGLIFLSYVQEWTAELIEIIKDMKWGFENDKQKFGKAKRGK